MRSVILAAAVLGAAAWVLQPSPAWPDTTEDCAHVAAMPGSASHPARPHRDESDLFVIAPQKGAQVLLCFHNHGALVSSNGTHRVTLGDIIVMVSVSVGNGAETIVIVPPDGWMVYPADLAETGVHDGEAVTVMLFAGIM